MIDGKPTPPVLYGLSDFPAAASFSAQAQKNIAAFSRIGIKLVVVDSAIGIGWHRVTPFETDAVLAEIANALEAAPDVKVLLRLHMNPPYWWLRDNPDECAVYRTPEGDFFGIDNGECDRLIRFDDDRHMRVSLASEKWLSEANEKLAVLCEVLKDTPEGDALLGIQPACGLYGEWHQWATEVSTPMKQRFVRYLRRKYRDISTLCEAYGKNYPDFEAVPFSPETFRAGDDGNFRSPEFSRFVMDSQESVQSSVSDAILTFCRTVKSILPDKLAGSFYGYYLGTGGNDMTIKGHLNIEQILSSPDIDFLAAPFCYLDNRDPEGVCVQRGLLESVRLHGKLWLTEMDQYPISVPRLGGDLGKKTEAISDLRKNVLTPLCAGQGLWYYDHRVIPRYVAEHPELAAAGSIYRKHGWWEDDYLMKEIAALQSLAERITQNDYRRDADVLLVYDTDSYYIRSRVFDFDYTIVEAVARSGVSYDTIYTHELAVCELDRYKCVIFVNAYMLTSEAREKYRRLTEGKLRVWLYAEGFCDGEKLDADNLSQTVGIKLKRYNAEPSILCYQDKNFNITEGTFAPFFALDDPDAEAIAHYGDGTPASAIKENDAWIALPLISQEVMRPLFRRAGAHIYTDSPDQIIEGGGITALFTAEGGRRVLRLKNGKDIDFSVTPYTVAVFESSCGKRLM